MHATPPSAQRVLLRSTRDKSCSYMIYTMFPHSLHVFSVTRTSFGEILSSVSCMCELPYDILTERSAEWTTGPTALIQALRVLWVRHNALWLAGYRARVAEIEGGMCAMSREWASDRDRQLSISPFNSMNQVCFLLYYNDGYMDVWWVLHICWYWVRNRLEHRENSHVVTWHIHALFSTTTERYTDPNTSSPSHEGTWERCMSGIRPRIVERRDTWCRYWSDVVGEDVQWRGGKRAMGEGSWSGKWGKCGKKANDYWGGWARMGRISWFVCFVLHFTCYGSRQWPIGVVLVFLGE